MGEGGGEIADRQPLATEPEFSLSAPSSDYWEILTRGLSPHLHCQLHLARGRPSAPSYPSTPTKSSARTQPAYLFLFPGSLSANNVEPGRHAELCLLDQIPSWTLNESPQYRITCYISYSPCHACAVNLAAFLRENSHVRLRICASRIYSVGEYKTGLRTLQEAWAQVTIMTPKEFEHCWETFVDHQGTRFPRWDNIDENCQRLSMALKRILQEN
ncbi:DNA dC-_dU-editing enzyme APOBEC-3A-like [Hipposideros larvatus]